MLIPALATLDDVALDTLDCLPRDAAREGRRGPQRTSNRMAALFLDTSGPVVREALTALRFSKHEITWASALVHRWHTLGDAIASSISQGEPSDAQVRRWLAAIGRTHAGAFLRVAGARWSAQGRAGRPAPPEVSIRWLHRRFTSARLSAPIEVADLAIGGDDLRRAGIPPGPIYAKILGALLSVVLDAPARNTPQALLDELPGVVANIERGPDTLPQH